MQAVCSIGSGSVLVTGGTGALGTAVAGWLVSQEAKRIVLVNRSGRLTAAAAELVAGPAFAAEVSVCLADMACAADVAALVPHCEIKVSTAISKSANEDISPISFRKIRLPTLLLTSIGIGISSRRPSGLGKPSTS